MPKNDIFVQHGARRIAKQPRQQDDFYATAPYIVEAILPCIDLNKNVWEPACGMGHISEVLKAHGHDVMSTDLVDRGYGEANVDFLETNFEFDGDIFTNPPYKCAREFVQHALDVVPEGHHVVMFLKLTFLEGQKRRKLFDKNPPEFVYVSTSRVRCPINGDFDSFKDNQSAIAYAWFIWTKGYKGDTKLRWFN